MYCRMLYICERKYFLIRHPRDPKLRCNTLYLLSPRLCSIIHVLSDLDLFVYGGDSLINELGGYYANQITNDISFRN